MRQQWTKLYYSRTRFINFDTEYLNYSALFSFRGEISIYMVCYYARHFRTNPNIALIFCHPAKNCTTFLLGCHALVTLALTTIAFPYQAPHRLQGLGGPVDAQQLSCGLMADFCLSSRIRKTQAGKTTTTWHNEPGLNTDCRW